jgi:ABC-type lipoprotein export system ATPase subunit
LLDELTAAENIEMAALLDPTVAVPAGWNTAHVMGVLQIDHIADRYPSNTPGGEQQRTAIGRAMRLRPTLR